MKERIKKWLGITKLEKEVYPTDTNATKSPNTIFGYWWGIDWGRSTTLIDEHKQLRKDFEELDNKFDALERYLKIEYFKKEEETQTYDWADKSKEEGYRKAPMSYKKMKESKQT